MSVGQGVVVLGAGTFAVEVARYLDDLVRSGREEYRVERFLVVGDETVAVPPEQVSPPEQVVPEPGTRVVLAVADPATRRPVIDRIVADPRLEVVDVVHPDARVEPGQLLGPGNIIGPDCYVGAEAVLGGFNVVHYHCSIGHHTRIGENNFFAPNFHCGSSVRIGDDNFFGLSCTVAPGVDTGSDGRFQAGITLFEDAPSGHSHLVPSRLKSIKLP